MKLASLFDGSGGFPLGGMLAGITPVWAAEVEPFSIRVTTKRFPDMKHYGDVSKINGAEVEPVDIITFGSPCQDMSIAGKRAGLDGARSGLFYEATRIIREMRDATDGKYPRWAVWENVPGAFSSNNGKDFKAVLEELVSIPRSERGQSGAIDIPMPERWDSAGLIMGDGYSVCWRLLDAQYWGVPQRRKRIFLVADFAGQRAGGVLFKSEGLSGYTPQGFRTWKGTAANSEKSVRDTIVFDNHMQDCRYNELGEVGTTVTSRYGTGGNNVPLVVLNDQGGESIGVEDNKSPTLRSEAHGNMPTAKGSGAVCAIQGSMIGRDEKNGPQGSGISEDVSFTLNTADRHAVGYQNGVMQGYIVRRLTPTECARLQGFPDWWCSDLGTDDPAIEDIMRWRTVFDTYSSINGTKSKSDNQICKWLKDPHTDSAEYKMWGNGVALPCVYFVLSGIVWAENYPNESIVDG